MIKSKLNKDAIATMYKYFDIADINNNITHIPKDVYTTEPGYFFSKRFEFGDKFLLFVIFISDKSIVINLQYLIESSLCGGLGITMEDWDTEILIYSNSETTALKSAKVYGDPNDFIIKMLDLIVLSDIMDKLFFDDFGTIIEDILKQLNIIIFEEKL